MCIIIKIASALIILLGLVHISFAFPLQMNTGTLWFVGAGMAIIFAGFLNLAAIDIGGSTWAKVLAAIANVINLVLFCFALRILNEPQLYLGIALFLIASIAFSVILVRRNYNKRAV